MRQNQRAKMDNGPRLKQTHRFPTHVAPMQSLSTCQFTDLTLHPPFRSRTSPNLLLHLSKALSASTRSTPMAFAHYLTAVRPVPVVTSEQTKISILPLFTSSSSSSSSVSTQSLFSKARKLSLFPRFRRIGHKGNCISL